MTPPDRPGGAPPPTPHGGRPDRPPPGTAAVVGPGRVGRLLVAALEAAGHRVLATGGGGRATRRRVAERWPSLRVEADPAAAASGADLVLVATPDDAVVEVVTAMAAAGAVHEGQRVVHVAGALGLSALRRAALAGARVAACHPAQTVPQGAGPGDLAGAAWAVTAHQEDRGWARALVRDLGGHPHDVPDDRRELYHAALTVGSNAVGAAVAVARQLLSAARVKDPAAFLQPLTDRSVANVLDRGAGGLTGPVVRGDAGTLARHLARLDADLPALGLAYRHLAEVVLAQVWPALDDERIAAVRRALRSPTPGGEGP